MADLSERMASLSETPAPSSPAQLGSFAHWGLTDDLSKLNDMSHTVGRFLPLNMGKMIAFIPQYSSSWAPEISAGAFPNNATTVTPHCKRESPARKTPTDSFSEKM